MSLSAAVSRCADLKDAAACGRRLAREALGSLSAPGRGLLVFSPFQGVDHAKLLAGLREASGGLPLAGGTTYGGISTEGLEERAVVVMALGGEAGVSTGVGRGQARDARGAGREAARSALASAAGEPRLAILMHEPQMGEAFRIVEGARDVFGSSFPIVGGGTGTGFIMEQSPFSKQFVDGRVLAGSCVAMLLSGDVRASFGFSHGGEAVTPPVGLTKAAGNVVLELDGRPALDVIEEALGCRCSGAGSPFSVFNVSLGRVGPEGGQYPLLGLWGVDRARRALLCGSPLEAGVSYRFVKTSPEDVLRTTRESASRARQGLTGGAPAAVLAFDCYGRKLLLGGHDLVGEELKALREECGGAPVAGMYSGSEIGYLNPDTPHAGSHYSHASTSLVFLG